MIIIEDFNLTVILEYELWSLLKISIWLILGYELSSLLKILIWQWF